MVVQFIVVNDRWLRSGAAYHNTFGYIKPKLPYMYIPILIVCQDLAEGWKHHSGNQLLYVTSSHQQTAVVEMKYFW